MQHQHQVGGNDNDNDIDIQVNEDHVHELLSPERARKGKDDTSLLNDTSLVISPSNMNDNISAVASINQCDSPSSHKLKQLPKNVSSLFLLSIQDEDKDNNHNHNRNHDNASISQLSVDDINLIESAPIALNESAVSNDDHHDNDNHNHNLSQQRQFPSPRLIAARNFDKICENGEAVWQPPIASEAEMIPDDHKHNDKEEADEDEDVHIDGNDNKSGDDSEYQPKRSILHPASPDPSLYPLPRSPSSGGSFGRMRRKKKKKRSRNSKRKKSGMIDFLEIAQDYGHNDNDNVSEEHEEEDDDTLSTAEFCQKYHLLKKRCDENMDDYHMLPIDLPSKLHPTFFNRIFFNPERQLIEDPMKRPAINPNCTKFGDYCFNTDMARNNEIFSDNEFHQAERERRYNGDFVQYDERDDRDIITIIITIIMLIKTKMYLRKS